MTTGIMEVTVVGARDLKNTEFFGKVDPYVVIRYKDEEQKSTTGQRKTTKFLMQHCTCLRGQGGRRAAWNEKFKFRVEYPAPDAENQQPKLFLKLMDSDSFTKDDYLGLTTIYLKEVFELGLENGKAELPIQKYRVVSNNNSYHGEIKVGITFTVTGESIGKKMDRKKLAKANVLAI